MLKSMTGFGKASADFGGKAITVEIKSLNSRYMDLNVRQPYTYKEKEMELRKLITDRLNRGKVDVNIMVESSEDAGAQSINPQLLKTYFEQLKGIAEELGQSTDGLMNTILKLPGVVEAEATELDEEEWKVIMKLVHESLDELERFRLDEGNKLREELKMRAEIIGKHAAEVKKLDPKRIESLRVRLNEKLAEVLANENFDKSRLEQEILYYSEKLDITEELVRLAAHCEYYLQLLEEKDSMRGKKLSFVSQEMGREINTLGAKANDHEMQRHVVQMKDELEKIKEQVMNVL